jgi:hypothetical protein
LQVEGFFRDANDAIAEKAREIAFAGPVPFLCECADTSCRRLIPVSIGEYEAVRAHPARFVTLPSHSLSTLSKTVDENSRFAVHEAAELPSGNR